MQRNRDFPPFNEHWGRVTGAAQAAQNVVEALHTPLGRLPWAPERGSNIIEWLNAGNVPPSAIQSELRRVTIATPGVVESTVRTEYDPAKDEHSVHFQGTDGTQQTITME